LDLIHQDLINPEDFQMIGQQLSTELEFTRKLVDNLLHWALLQQGGLLVLPSQIQLRAIVQDNIGLLQKTAVEKKIELLNHVSHSAVAYADPNLVNIVVRNLINNALKFTRPNGRVEIKTQESSDCLIVSIADNGVGMTAEQQNKLFAIQTHFSTRGTQLEKGTGLGLIVSKEFVENSYGKIWVESIPDQGATFYFSLPLAPLQMGT
jgi:signal transduction histidine kinase